MSSCTKRALVIFLLIGALAPLAAIAHQLQVAMTTVSFKDRAGSIEVIHRFYIHDTEHAMSAIAGRRVDIVLDESVQQQFGQYVSGQFQLLDQDKKTLPLSLVGLELEGDFIWVYQETPIPGNLTKLTVVNAALLDFLPEQVNTVNVECGKELSTLKFSGDTRTARAGIDFSTCRPNQSCVHRKQLRHKFSLGAPPSPLIWVTSYSGSYFIRALA